MTLFIHTKLSNQERLLFYHLLLIKCVVIIMRTILLPKYFTTRGDTVGPA